MSAAPCPTCWPISDLASRRCARGGRHPIWPRTWCYASAAPMRAPASWAARWPATPGASRPGSLPATRSAELIELIRTGPPRMSLFGLPGADDRLNLVEYFVHHEDVLRAQPGWQPRKISAELTDILWDRLSLARLMMRRGAGRRRARPRRRRLGHQRRTWPGPDHRQGAHAGGDGHRRSRRADVVDHGAYWRRGCAPGRRRRGRRGAAIGSLAPLSSRGAPVGLLTLGGRASLCCPALASG